MVKTKINKIDDNLREMNVDKNVNGDYVLSIYYIHKCTRKTKIKYNIVHHVTWIVKYDGLTYRIFNDVLERKYNENKSNTLRYMGL